MRWFLLFWVLAGAASAEERWAQFRSGPFELFTNAGAGPGRETLGRFAEFRFALGQLLGNADLETQRPVRILLFQSPKERGEYPATPVVLDGRDRDSILLAAGAAIPAGLFHECTRLFLDANTARMPAAYERGLIDLFSTIDIRGVRITLGTPPPAAQRTRDWARIHLFVTGADYYGKLRVLLFNLQKGVDEDAAYRNAFGQPRAEIERQVDAHFAAGSFQPVEISGLPLHAGLHFAETPAKPETVRLALADLLIGDRSRRLYDGLIAGHAYEAEANEGLGLLALEEKRHEDARRYFAEAVAKKIPSPRAYLEYARLEPDAAKAVAALQQAAQQIGDPAGKGSKIKLAPLYSLMAQRQTDPRLRLQYLKQAAEFAPRDATAWQALAEAYDDAKNFAEAAKAWRAAEQASTTDEQRSRMARGRLAVEGRRLDWEAAGKQRAAAEEAAHLNQLKAQARAELRAAEAKANQENASNVPAPATVVPWWEGPKPGGRVTGVLKRLDCSTKPPRLVVEGDDHKLVRLTFGDPSRIAILGGGSQTLGCGPLPARRAAIEYFPGSDTRSGAAGEVATIEFQ